MRRAGHSVDLESCRAFEIAGDRCLHADGSNADAIVPRSDTAALGSRSRPRCPGRGRSVDLQLAQPWPELVPISACQHAPQLVRRRREGPLRSGTNGVAMHGLSVVASTDITPPALGETACRSTPGRTPIADRRQWNPTSNAGISLKYCVADHALLTAQRATREPLHHPPGAIGCASTIAMTVAGKIIPATVRAPRRRHGRDGNLRARHGLEGAGGVCAGSDQRDARRAESRRVHRGRSNRHRAELLWSRTRGHCVVGDAGTLHEYY